MNPLPASTPFEPPSYFENPLMPGKKMFLCTGLNASLAVDSCKVMFASANATKDAPDNLMRCRGCKVGACHSGASTPDASSLRGKNICSRCQRTDLRLIGENVCVSCKNREYECRKGRNAKGKAPTKHPKLERRSLRYCLGGETRTLVRAATISTDELVVELLRDSPGRVLMGRGIGKSSLNVRIQGSLF